MNDHAAMYEQAGLGLKAHHVPDVLAASPSLGFFEVHTENYMGAGGPMHADLEAVAARYPLSFHGVALSLGSPDGLDARHLKRTRDLVDRYKPALVSEHLAWSAFDGVGLNDLLPLPLTAESLSVVCNNVEVMQEAVGRQVLIENPSSYLAFTESHIPEPEFLSLIAERTGCGVLLDVNNVYVSAANLGFDAVAYLDALSADIIGEVHLAGHAVRDIDGAIIRIDDHGGPVCDDVWALYARLIARTGAVATMVEWDSDVPAFKVLLAEAEKATAVLKAGRQADANANAA